MKCESKFFGWTEELPLRVDENKQEPQPTGKGWGYYHVIGVWVLTSDRPVFETRHLPPA